MKIAFASRDGVYVNEHFGWCKQFYLYEITKESFLFVKILNSSDEITDEINKLTYKIECLEDAHIVYVAQIGPKASTMVKASGIFPMQSTIENEKISDVITQIMSLAATNPPLWMQRILIKNGK